MHFPVENVPIKAARLNLRTQNSCIVPSRRRKRTSKSFLFTQKTTSKSSENCHYNCRTAAYNIAIAASKCALTVVCGVLQPNVLGSILAKTLLIPRANGGILFI